MADTETLYSAAQIRDIEQRQIYERGTPGYTLMQRAATAAFHRCQHYLSPGARVLVLTGPGNNGGDGYVVARLLREAGYGVRLISLTQPDALRGDALQAKNDYLPFGEIERFSGQLPPTNLVVDALLGTGLQRPLAGDFLVAVQLVNAQPAPVLAIDIPSGLDGDTGEVLGAAILATETVTFIGKKSGLERGQGPRYSGHITVDTLGVDLDLLRQSDSLLPLNGSILARYLPPRENDAHKGHFGHAMLVGGYRSYQGAIRMAAEAAARTGAGLVTVLTHKEHAALISAQRPEIMSCAIENQNSEVMEILNKGSCFAVGPGLGMSDWSRFLFEMVTALDAPMVVDADGLNWLAHHPEIKENWILTPHPGEASRLLDCQTSDIQHDRLGAVTELQSRYGGIVVLKGAGTLVSDGQQIWLNEGGNPGMASGGMGDVLTGIITGLLAQLKDPLTATLCGVAAHTAAADLAAGSTPRGLLAMDVVEQLRQVVNPVNLNRHLQINETRRA